MSAPQTNYLDSNSVGSRIMKQLPQGLAPVANQFGNIGNILNQVGQTYAETPGNSLGEKLGHIAGGLPGVKLAKQAYGLRQVYSVGDALTSSHPLTRENIKNASNGIINHVSSNKTAKQYLQPMAHGVLQGIVEHRQAVASGDNTKTLAQRMMVNTREALMDKMGIADGHVKSYLSGRIDGQQFVRSTVNDHLQKYLPTAPEDLPDAPGLADYQNKLAGLPHNADAVEQYKNDTLIPRALEQLPQPIQDAYHGRGGVDPADLINQLHQTGAVNSDEAGLLTQGKEKVRQAAVSYATDELKKQNGSKGQQVANTLNALTDEKANFTPEKAVGAVADHMWLDSNRDTTATHLINLTKGYAERAAGAAKSGEKPKPPRARDVLVGAMKAVGLGGAAELVPEAKSTADLKQQAKDQVASVGDALQRGVDGARAVITNNDAAVIPPPPNPKRTASEATDDTAPRTQMDQVMNPPPKDDEIRPAPPPVAPKPIPKEVAKPEAPPVAPKPPVVEPVRNADTEDIVAHSTILPPAPPVVKAAKRRPSAQADNADVKLGVSSAKKGPNKGAYVTAPVVQDNDHDPDDIFAELDQPRKVRLNAIKTIVSPPATVAAENLPKQKKGGKSVAQKAAAFSTKDDVPVKPREKAANGTVNAGGLNTAPVLGTDDTSGTSNAFGTGYDPSDGVRSSNNSSFTFGQANSFGKAAVGPSFAPSQLGEQLAGSGGALQGIGQTLPNFISSKEAQSASNVAKADTTEAAATKAESTGADVTAATSVNNTTGKPDTTATEADLNDPMAVDKEEDATKAVSDSTDADDVLSDSDKVFNDVSSGVNLGEAGVEASTGDVLGAALTAGSAILQGVGIFDTPSNPKPVLPTYTFQAATENAPVGQTNQSSTDASLQSVIQYA